MARASNALFMDRILRAVRLTGAAAMIEVRCAMLLIALRADASLPETGSPLAHVTHEHITHSSSNATQTKQ